MDILEAVNMKECRITDDVIPDGAFMEKKSLLYYAFPEYIVEIGEDAFKNTSLTGALVLPDNIEVIGKAAFKETLINSVYFTEGLREIGNQAFYGCSLISGSLHLPESLRIIGGGAFQSCKGFNGSLHLPSSVESIGGWAFFES